jgi:hypothetical protein
MQKNQTFKYAKELKNYEDGNKILFRGFRRIMEMRFISADLLSLCVAKDELQALAMAQK